MMGSFRRYAFEASKFILDFVYKNSGPLPLKKVVLEPSPAALFLKYAIQCRFFKAIFMFPPVSLESRKGYYHMIFRVRHDGISSEGDYLSALEEPQPPSKADGKSSDRAGKCCICTPEKPICRPGKAVCRPPETSIHQL